jgi:cell division protein FtsN
MMEISKRNMNQKSYINQEGNTFIGIVIGLILGLGIALFVAYVISKNSPEEKINLRPAEISLSPKSTNLSDSSQVPDVNEPLRKNKPSDEVSNDPVASVVKSNQDTSPAIVPPVEVSKSDVIYWVQLGAYGDKSTAESEKASFALQGVQTKLIEGKSDSQTIWRLRLGPFKTESEVQTSKAALETIGISYTVIKANKS